REIPVIFVSAFQLTDFDRHKVYESGAVDFVSVPVVPIVLRTKVAIFADLYRKSRDLARLNQELESRVYHRTTELRQTQSALMEAGKRKDEFLAILAHELRNPLAPMQNSLELLRRLEVQDPIVESICNTFDRQLHQLTRLIDDLMDVSRITRNKLELKKESVLLSTIVASAIESTCKRLDLARQRLVVEQPSGDVWLKADSVRLSQVITNLINNASKFSPAEKSIYLNVTVDDGEIHVSVRDEGIGMDELELAQVCEPFYQVNRSRDLSQGGLGIGLTLVQTIVEKHEGKVRIESEGLGEGTCVTFIIPVDADTKPQPAPDEEVKVPARSHRFLVVDDNEDAAHTLCRLLEFLGHSVSVCYNG
ncbi:MAG TPA: ATP-binding protein, partial [Terriglobia bacterium]|nr:ATP-binding protein [Terriglobia bacterium]